mgnify:CR=1 FL=1
MWSTIIILSIAFLVLLFYVIRILNFCFGLQRLKEYKINTNKQKKAVSVVVPFYNEEENLPLLISSLSDQNFQHSESEIILVDDYSDDHSREIANKAIKGNNTIHLIRSSLKKGKKYALLAGIKSAKNEDILITDADCTLSKDWAKHMISFITEKDLLLACGAVIYEKKRGFFRNFQSLDFLSLVATGAASFGNKNPLMCNAANMGFKKSLFLEAFKNLHPSHPSGDDMFLLEYAKKKYPEKIDFCLDKSNIVRTKPVSGIKQFFKQRMRWASKSKLYKDNSLIGLSVLILLSALTFAGLLFASVFSAIYLKAFLVYFSIKLLIDFYFINKATRKFSSTYLLKFFVPSLIIHPFYIIIAALGGFLSRSEKE